MGFNEEGKDLVAKTFPCPALSGVQCILLKCTALVDHEEPYLIARSEVKLNNVTNVSCYFYLKNDFVVQG